MHDECTIFVSFLAIAGLQHLRLLALRLQSHTAHTPCICFYIAHITFGGLLVHFMFLLLFLVFGVYSSTSKHSHTNRSIFFILHAAATVPQFIMSTHTHTHTRNAIRNKCVYVCGHRYFLCARSTRAFLLSAIVRSSPQSLRRIRLSLPITMSVGRCSRLFDGARKRSPKPAAKTTLRSWREIPSIKSLATAPCIRFSMYESIIYRTVV